MALAEMETGEAAAAAKRVEELLEREPLDGDALILLATFREKNDQPEEAILLLEQAAVIPEKRAAALLAHGRILVNQFRYEEALERLEESQKIEPGDSLKGYIEAIRDLSQ
jgi:Tfp pilus assembly protein PilF